MSRCACGAIIRTGAVGERWCPNGCESRDTKHVTPSAPRTLSEKPFQLDYRALVGDAAPPRITVTRGTPIEKLMDSGGYPETSIVAKLNEIIDRLNAMNEVSR